MSAHWDTVLSKFHWFLVNTSVRRSIKTLVSPKLSSVVSIRAIAVVERVFIARLLYAERHSNNFVTVDEGLFHGVGLCRKNKNVLFSIFRELGSSVQKSLPAFLLRVVSLGMF